MNFFRSLHDSSRLTCRYCHATPGSVWGEPAEVTLVAKNHGIRTFSDVDRPTEYRVQCMCGYAGPVALKAIDALELHERHEYRKEFEASGYRHRQFRSRFTTEEWKEYLVRAWWVFHKQSEKGAFSDF